MSANIDEFTDTLNAEQYVDLQKLRSYSRYGIPPAIRGEVWLYLLGVLSPDRTNEITSVRSKYASYANMDKLPPTHAHRLRLECTRYYNRRLVPYARRRRQPGLAPNSMTTSAMIRLSLTTSMPSTSPGTSSIAVKSNNEDEAMDIMAFTTSVENVLSAYLNRNLATEYHHGLVPLVAPLVWTLKTEAGMYFSFERLMTIREEYTSKHPLPARLTFFMTIFRQFLPDLFSYFEEEAVDTRELAAAWLESLFSREMPIGMLMRVWDVYFSIQDPMEFHPFVCLAILTTCKDALEELDQSEVRSMLLSLPVMDVDRLVVEAHNLRLSYQHSQTRGGGQWAVDY
ncbi:BZ3500_MvSof-1268-A1-R1_Chr6-3g08917 [Microbotryum saponariae]|uniref:BZ3500_MvSof-1268-A1-R1_Chr6-3g08917 protein n=1 Tax=Microbotryum saponariae TaxID=289078 RepID=A0A2X0LN97_9BASI|nr:BZ3500_MvSof-1268-A1-R1_Chr6-3g08917 [Microbotryum saponariae]SDA07519.1 BZ3501_MvSof-1269-A2-R1_Chr6-2g08621 [Microbotryum saponariae]